MTLRFLRSSPKPETDEILALKSDYVDYHQRRIATNRTDQDFFELNYSVPSPDGKSPLLSPAAYQIVEDLTNHIVAELPTFNVLPRSHDHKHLTQSGKLTSWINGYWRAVQLTHLLRRMVWHDAVRGCHVLKVFHDPGAWPAKPNRPEMIPELDDTADTAEQLAYLEDLDGYLDRVDSYKDDLDAWVDYTEEHLPIMPQLIDPLYCFWEPSPDPSRVVICWDRPVDDILRSRPHLADELAGVKSGTKLQWCEYWDDTYYAYWVESYGSNRRGGQTVHWDQEPAKHGFGFFPFVIDGPWITPLESPDKMYPSLYYGIKPMLQYESSLLTMVAHMIRINGWAPLIVKTDKPDAQRPIIDMTPGRVNYIDENEDARYLEFSGQTMSVLERQINAVSGYVDKGTGLGDTLKGAPKGKSGYQQSQVAQMARVTLVPVEQSTTRTLDKASRMVLKLVRAVGEKVTVQGHHGQDNGETTIGPADVTRFGQIETRLRTVLPIDEGAKIANYNNMNKAGWISAATAARLAGVENPEDEHALWRAEQIAAMPELQQAQAVLYLQEHDPELYAMYMRLQQEHQQQAQQQQKPGVQMGPGGPGGAGGGAQPGHPPPPGQPPQPGSAQQANQVQRQGQQGGAAPKRLPGTA